MPAPEFPVDPYRYDPYKNFKFRVKWDGKYVAGVSKVSAITRTTEVVTYREDSDPGSVHITPGQTKFEPILLERGVTHNLEFETWCNKVRALANGSAEQRVSVKDFRKDIIIEFYNEAGQKVFIYNIYRCWVSEYTMMPELDSSDNAVLIQSITLENEGWNRDVDITEPKEPSF